MVTSGSADGTGVTFQLADRPRRLAGVWLTHELGGGPIALDRLAGQWTLRLDQPPVDRMEYLFEVLDHNDRRWTITDPANELRAPGAFGDKSVVEFDSYTPPAWLDAPEPSGNAVELEIPVLDSTMSVLVREPEGCDGPAPLLLVHDGPEFDKLGGFSRWLGAMIADGAIPPTRVALLDPGDRNLWYSANAEYADAVANELMPRLPESSAVIGIGLSLGALAMLHLHRTHPGTLDALFLQSGSFFTPATDEQEAQFSGFVAVTDFVATLGSPRPDERPVPTVLTCGTVEENLANNRAVGAALAGLGYDAALHEVRDAHNYVAWRDALHPHLTELIARAS